MSPLKTFQDNSVVFKLSGFSKLNKNPTKAAITYIGYENLASPNTRKKIY